LLEIQAKDQTSPIGGALLVKEIKKAALSKDSVRTFVLIATGGITKELQDQGTSSVIPLISCI